jgi:hypothetical protein
MLSKVSLCLQGHYYNSFSSRIGGKERRIQGGGEKQDLLNATGYAAA